MDLQLTGKRVLVTGGSKGIGLATVQAFLAEGASVTAASRTLTPELEATGVDFVAADLSTSDGPAQLIERALAIDSRLDVLVNNAGGGNVPPHSLADALGGDDDLWDQTFALNLFGAMRTTRAALPALARNGGVVINVSSDSAKRPWSSPLPYSVAKAGLNAFSRGLAETLAGQGIRVNTVTPSATRTALMEGTESFASVVASVMGVEHEAFLQALPKQNGSLTEAFIEPSEIARAIVLLASPTMPSAIGSNWHVDAGAMKSV